jgi:5-methyltetrahydrofolate--homocysteine methyltransferase
MVLAWGAIFATVLIHELGHCYAAFRMGGGADAIVLETFNELAELVIALSAVKKACGLPVVACLTFSSGPDKAHTMMGNSPADLAAAARKHGADAIGANCGVGPDNYVKVAKLLRETSDLPIWIKPNAGVPTMGRDGRPKFPMTPQEFASFVPDLLAGGANFLGGCCGTGPAHIEALREAVDKAGKR